MSESFKVHRIRSIPVRSPPVVSIAASPNHRFLAALRDNGAIDIWLRGHRWSASCHSAALDAAARGSDVGASALVWLDNVSLLAGSLAGLLVVLDRKGQIRHFIQSSGGAVWALAASPTHPGVFAVGCEDGCVRLFRSEANVDDRPDQPLGPPLLWKTLAKQKGRIVSLAWHLRGEILVSGDASGGVAVWAPHKGIVPKQQFEVAKRASARASSPAEAAIVWAVDILPDTTVVTGDSHGQTAFWSARFGTPLHQVTEHTADVLALASSSDGRFVFATGVDSKIVVFQRNEEAKGMAAPWVVAAHERLHTHDVRALVVLPALEEDDHDVLASGSVDCSINLTNIDALPQKWRSYKLNRTRAASSVSLARSARALVSHRDHTVSLWTLGETLQSVDTAALPSSRRAPLQKQLECAATIAMKSPTLVLCSAGNSELSMVAVATRDETKLFRVDRAMRSQDDAEDDNDATDCRISRVRHEPLAPAAAMKFCDSGALIIGARNGDIVWVAPDASTHRVIEAGLVAGAIVDLVVSLSEGDHSVWIAVARVDAPVRMVRVDENGVASDAYDLPDLGAQVVSVNFDVTAEVLYACCNDMRTLAWDLLKRELTQWSRDHSSNLPMVLLRRRELLRTPVFNPGEPGRPFLWTDSWFMPMDVSVAPPTTSEERQMGKKNFWIYKRFKNVVLMDCVGENEFVVVEHPEKAFLDQIPQVLFRSRFGI